MAIDFALLFLVPVALIFTTIIKLIKFIIEVDNE